MHAAKSPMLGRILPLVCGRSGPQHRRHRLCAVQWRAYPRSFQAGGRRCARHSLEFPCGDGDTQDWPALAAGCPVICKPASETPLTMLALMPILEKAGVPKGIVNIIPSRQIRLCGRQAAARPARAHRVFHRLDEVGRKLLHSAADCVVNTAMELGGNAPFIVCEDADIDAGEGALIAKMRNMGEACTAANRFYVHESVHDEFAKKLADRMGAMKMGNGLEDGCPRRLVVNKETLDRWCISSTTPCRRARRFSLAPTKLPAARASSNPPTVLVDVPDNAALNVTRFFGPVASLQKFKTEEEVIRRSNDTEYGLIAYVYTKDVGRGLALSEKA